MAESGCICGVGGKTFCWTCAQSLLWRAGAEGWVGGGGGGRAVW